MKKKTVLPWVHIMSVTENGTGMSADTCGEFVRISIINNFHQFQPHYFTPDGHRFGSEGALIRYIDEHLVAKDDKQ